MTNNMKNKTQATADNVAQKIKSDIDALQKIRDEYKQRVIEYEREEEFPAARHFEDMNIQIWGKICAYQRVLKMLEKREVQE